MVLIVLLDIADFDRRYQVRPHAQRTRMLARLSSPAAAERVGALLSPLHPLRPIPRSTGKEFCVKCKVACRSYRV